MKVNMSHGCCYHQGQSNMPFREVNMVKRYIRFGLVIIACSFNIKQATAISVCQGEAEFEVLKSFLDVIASLQIPFIQVTQSDSHRVLATFKVRTTGPSCMSKLSRKLLQLLWSLMPLMPS